MSNSRSCDICRGAGHRFTHPDEYGQVAREACSGCHGSGLASPFCAECDEPITGEAPKQHCGLDYHPTCFARMLDEFDGVCVAFDADGDLGCIECAAQEQGAAADARYDAWRDDVALRGVA